MTSHLRKELAAKIVECVGLTSSTLSQSTAEGLASAMYISRAKGCVNPEIQLSVKDFQKHFQDEKLDVDNIHLNESQFTYARIVEGNIPAIAFGVQEHFLINNVIQSINNSSDLWKGNNSLTKSRVVVEFSSPNIAKPFHVGHLRSTILGNFVANIHQAAGHDVIRTNYLGDWGTQFGTLTKGFKLFGSESHLKINPIQHLFEVYVQASKLANEDSSFLSDAKKEFQKLEQNDTATTQLWQQFRHLSVDNLSRTYERLGISFNCYEGESWYRDKVQTVYDQLHSLGLLNDHLHGTKTINFAHPSGVRQAVLQKSDGTSMYLSRDIAAAIGRKERYNFDKMFYVVDNAQADHFVALFDVLRQMGHSWSSDLHHVKFGRIHGMSTRKGAVVFLQDILDEARNLAIGAMKKSPNTRVSVDELEEVGDQLGIAAVLINDMRSRRQQDFNFEWKKAVQTKGDTGIFLIYVHARLCSIEDKSGVGVNKDCDLSVLREPEIVNLVFQLARYEQMCCSALVELQPCIIVQYLFTLGRTVSHVLDSVKVKGQPAEIAEPRLLLFMAARRVLADGMKILGLTPLRRI